MKFSESIMKLWRSLAIKLKRKKNTNNLKYKNNLKITSENEANKKGN